MPRGSHNMTIHPSGDYLYNSNSDLIIEHRRRRSRSTTSRDPRRPKKVQDYPIPFVPASLGSESHDITFNKSGIARLLAALSQTLMLDTTEPAQAPSRSARSSTRRSTWCTSPTRSP